MNIKLKQLRQSKGWTQVVTARKLSLSLDAIKAIEGGRAFVSKDVLKRIFESFECKSFDEILEHKAS